MTLTVAQKGLVLAATPLLFQVAFLILAVRLQWEHADAQQLAAHSKVVISKANAVHTAVSDAHAAVRGYAITLDPEFAEPLFAALRDVPPDIDRLEELVRDNPAQGERVAVIRTTASDLLKWHEVTARTIGVAPADAIARIRTRTGLERMAAFRGAVRNLLAEEERLGEGREADLVATRRRTTVVFWGGAAAAVGATVAVGLAFGRGVLRRFAVLEENTRRLRAGQDLLPLSPGDEIARVDRAFRELTAELARATDRVRDLYDHAPCGYHSVDPDGTVVDMNRTELAWLGLSPSRALGRLRFEDVVAPGHRSKYRDALARVAATGSVADVELDMTRADGTTFPVLINSTSIRGPDGGFLRSRTTLTDLTERKRAEAAARLFADVTQNIPLGLLVYQLDPAVTPPALRFRSGNAYAAAALNVPVEAAVGRLVTDVFPAIPAEQVRRYTAVAVTGRPDDFGEFRYGDARVAERWWAVQAFALPDQCVGVAFRDVSDRKRVEDEVRRLTNELEDRVTARTAELAEANRDLAAKNAENEMFVYSVSHDLRSPLVNLQGFSQELEKAGRAVSELLAAPEVPAAVRDRGQALVTGKIGPSLGFIRAAVLRLSGIIDALLRLSRAGRVDYRWAMVDVAAIAARVVGAANGTIAQRGATVRVGDLPPAWGDSSAVEQAIGNLVGNALAYLDPVRPGEIEIGAVAPAASGVQTYFVRDNGLGIAPGHQAKIFQAFQRAHPGVGTGEGLGLAIVARVAERHRGKVWVESRPGEGSTFFLSLPALPPAPGR